ncbi:hypothetical protein QN239_03465 [Mycolicibacterium sp. Y3]
MKLKIDTQGVQFVGTRAAEPRTNFDTGQPRIDKATGLPQFAVQLLALDDSGGEVLMVTVPGDPNIVVGQHVTLTNLVAVPWSQNDRSGVAYRADAITAASATGGSTSATKPAGPVDRS